MNEPASAAVQAPGKLPVESDQWIGQLYRTYQQLLDNDCRFDTSCQYGRQVAAFRGFSCPLHWIGEFALDDMTGGQMDMASVDRTGLDPTVFGGHAAPPFFQGT